MGLLSGRKKTPQKSTIATPQLVLHEGVIERVFQDCMTFPTIEVGGRWIGYHYTKEENNNLRERFPSVVQTSEEVYVIIDYIPMGPNPESQSAVELQPDRRYQLWAYTKLNKQFPGLEVLGSWHSHIPNGLNRFSGGDHDGYHSKLNNPNEEYDYSNMLCSLIYDRPREAKDVLGFLKHAWFPKNAKIGTHNWIPNQEIQWINTNILQEFSRLIDPSDYLPYLNGGKVIDWFEAVLQLIKNHPYAPGSHPSIEIHPSNYSWRLVHEKMGVKIEVQMDNSCRIQVAVILGNSTINKKIFDIANEGLLELSNILDNLGINAPRFDLVNSMVAEAFEEIIDAEKEISNKDAIIEQQKLNIDAYLTKINSLEADLSSANGRLGPITNQALQWKANLMLSLDNMKSNLPKQWSPKVYYILLNNEIVMLEQMRKLGREGLTAIQIPQNIITEVLGKQTIPPPPPMPPPTKKIQQNELADKGPATSAPSNPSAPESHGVVEDQDIQE
jgi:hypothetical protein